MALRALANDRTIRSILGLDLIAWLLAQVPRFDPGAVLGSIQTWILGLATAYVLADKIVTERRLKKRSDEFRLGIEQQKELDAANRESLSGQLETTKKALDELRAESGSNQEKMRETLHKIRDEAESYQRQAEELREQLHDTSRLLHETDARLHAANQSNLDLTGRLHEMTRRLEAAARSTPAAVEAAVERAIIKAAQSDPEMPIAPAEGGV